MKVLIIVAVVTVLVALYVVWLRPWLKTKPWAQGFFAAIEPVEILLFKKSETILWARLKVLAGLVLMALAQAGTIDLTPLMPFVPDQYQGLVKFAVNLLPLIVALDGSIGERLRNGTTKPIELVAIADKDITPAVAQAISRADNAKEIAVEAVAVETAKAA